MFLTYLIFCWTILPSDSVLTIRYPCGIAVKYEARLDDGTLVKISDGVEFTAKDGQYKHILL